MPSKKNDNKKLPYISFFVGDYLKDTRVLSLEARGAWVDMLCLMHDGDRRGYLSRAGTPITMAQLARVCGEPEATIGRVVAEILGAGVASKDEAGTIYSRRIVRDEKARVAAVKNGKNGGNPGLKGGVKGGVNPPVKGDDNPPLKGPHKPRLEMEDGDGDDVGDEADAGGSESSGGGGGGGAGLPSGFRAFWNDYPRRTAKREALKAWKKLNPNDELQMAILGAIEAQKRSEQWRKGVIPHPATWINQARWEDESAPAAKSNGVQDVADWLTSRQAQEKANG